MTLTKRGKYWHSRFVLDGVEYCQSTKLTSHREAKAFEDQWRARVKLGQVGLAPAPAMSVVWANWYAASKGRCSETHRARAESAWRLHLEPVLGALKADQVDAGVVALVRQKYLDGKTKRAYGKKPRTLAGANTLLGYLRALLRHAAAEFPGLRLPEIALPRPQAPVRAYVPLSAVRQFLSAVDRAQNVHVGVAVRAMLFLGLREGEALSMRWEWYGPGLQTYTPGRTKGREALPLPVPRELRVFLHALGPQDLGLVLPAEDGKPHRAGFTRAACRRSGIPGITPHRLRTSCATLLAQAGVPIPVVSRMLRHRDIRTTLRYCEVGLSDLRSGQELAFSAHHPHSQNQDTA